MKPRKHQAQFIEVINRIQAGEDIRKIILSVTPGGGKSFIPIVAGKLIESGHADALAWIVPRQSLQAQGEGEFLDPLSRRLFNNKLMVRASTNDVDPCRGTNGFITTYQALGVDDHKTVINDFSKKRYILILDEYHHVEDGGIWHDALEQLFMMAKYAVMMTGTLERGDGKPIAFTDYRNKRPVLVSDIHTAIIRYSRRDALREKAILPIAFHVSDGEFRWRDNAGEIKGVDSFDDAKNGEIAGALYTALNTDFAYRILYESIDHFKEHRRIIPGAKMLVVTADYKQAQTISEMLHAGARPLKIDIATSHKPKEANLAIKKFKAGQIDILVTIAMAYEGLSVPAVSHICCLTHIRSTPWIEQMVARGVRIDPCAGPYGSQICHIFAPSDKKFVEIMKRIKNEQIASLKTSNDPEKNDFELAKIPGDGTGEGRQFVTPIGSVYTGISDHYIGCDGPIEPMQPTMPIETPSEKEDRLRAEIDSHVKTYSRENGYKPQRINAEIKKHMGKARDNMALYDLERLQIHLASAYPIGAKYPVAETVVKHPPRERKRVDQRPVPLRPVFQQMTFF